MDINALKSRLVFLLGNDLRNLTVTDLKECSFRTSRLVFSSLVSASPTLHEKSETISKINDIRSRRMGLLRNQPDSRDERKRVEEEYRHSFYEVILNCLLDSQYPPALEPFSDPLSMLKDDTDFRLGAIQHLLDNAVVSPSGLPAAIARTPVLGNKTFENTRCLSEHTTKVQQLPSTSSFCKKSAEEPADNSNSCSTSLIDDVNDIKSADNSKYQVQKSSSVTESFLTSINANDSSACSDEYDSLRHSYLILQHHNEQLAKQLKILQDSVCNRNAAEVKMDLLMRDFSSMVNEIAEIPNIGTTTMQSSFQKTTSRDDAPPASPSTVQSKSRPLGAVLEGGPCYIIFSL